MSQPSVDKVREALSSLLVVGETAKGILQYPVFTEAQSLQLQRCIDDLFDIASQLKLKM